MKKICLLGASGSIGRQTLDIIRDNPCDFVLSSFSVGHQTNKIKSILEEFPSVNHICVSEKNDYEILINEYPNISFYYGDNGLIDLINASDFYMLVNALVGFVGLKPTLTALKNNKVVALANKETLVVGGELVNDLLGQGYGKLVPIDSEHVAIAKCLIDEPNNVENIVLTASGGAFRHLTRVEMNSVKASDALNHPTWNMGEKITIDCANMINKCFEVIEAHYLFAYPYDKIKILQHDESYIHSLVYYKDQHYRFEMGKPDMHNPIRFALYEGNTPFETYICHHYKELKNYHFHDHDFSKYPLTKLAKIVIEEKGLYGAILNASNEVCNKAFLENKIPFLAIESIVTRMMNECSNKIHPTYEDIYEADYKARLKTREIIEKKEY